MLAGIGYHIFGGIASTFFLGFMHKLTIRIVGIKGPDQFDEIHRIAGELYRKGTDDCLYADLSREKADLVIAQINATPGLHADSFRWL